MKTQKYSKAWAFTLAFVMVLTTSFGGFGFAGINGAAEEIHAAGSLPTWSYPGSAPAEFTLGTDGTATNAGTVSNPYAISSAQDLANLSYLVNNGNTFVGICFEMTADITLNDGTFDAAGTFDPAVGDTAVKPWTPIGIYNSDDAKPFSGNFDGDGHIISGLYINSDSLNYQGLFGEVESGWVTDLGIENSYINVSGWAGGITAVVKQGTIISGCHYSGTIIIQNSLAGGIVGALWGGSTVSNCYAAGSVSANTGGIVGGITGYTDDTSNAITNCYSTTAVSGMNSVGGIAGNSGACEIVNCSSSGNINGEDHVGGIVGWMQNNATDTINCYSTGSVAGTNNVGGIVGQMSGTYIEISNCYAAGSISGTSAAGGIAGLKTAGTVTNCYWKESAPLIGIGSGTASATCVSKTASEMQASDFVTLLNGNAKVLNATAGSKKYSYWLSDIASVNDDYPLFGTGYYVTFNQNGGTGASAAYAISKSNGTVDLPATSPAKAGVVFKGWYTASSGGSQFTAASAVSADGIIYAQYYTLSTDAGLTSVAGQNDITPTGGAGTTTSSAIIWSLDAPNSVSALAPTDIVSAADSTVALYSDASFTTTTASIALTAGVAKTAYIKVTAQNGTTIKYYAVTITRSLITVSGAKIYANGNHLTLIAGTTPGYTVAFPDADYDGVLDLGEPIQTIAGAAGSNDTAGYDLSTFDIYGGSNVVVVNNPTIYFFGGVVKNIYGGGDGQDTTGWVNVIVKGGTVKESIYGSGVNSSAQNLGISILGGTINGDVKGGSAVSGNVSLLKNIKIGGGTIRGAVTDCTESQLVKFQYGAPDPIYVYKTTLTLEGITVETAVTAAMLVLTGAALDYDGAGYGLNGVKTTANGELTFYLPTGAAIATYDSDTYAATVTANHNNVFVIMSSNASLTTVTALADTSPGAQSGLDADHAIAWELNVANAKSTLALGDIVAAENAAFKLYSNVAFTTEITGVGTLSLAEGDTVAYIKVTAQDTTTVKYYAVTITRAVAQAAPTATVQAITGTTQVGQTLTGHYTYSDVNADVQGVSTFKWYRADDNLGTAKAAIAGATSITYALQAADLGKYISFEVTPVAATGTPTGFAAEGATVGPIVPAQAAPTATVQAITGTTQVGQTLTGHYTYSDVNGDAQGASTFKWYRADDNLGTAKAAIAGATSITYVLQAADLGKFISFEVTPIALTGTTTGFAAEGATVGPISAAPTGGGSGGGSTATTVINTNTGTVTGSQIDKAAGIAKQGDSVTIQSNQTSEVTFPASGLGSLIEKDNSLTVVTENGTLTFDGKAVSSMDTQATAADIEVIVKDVEKNALTQDQQTMVGDKSIYDLSVMSGGKLISNFGGGKITVSLPYELKADETAENLTVWYLADDGTLTEISCAYDAKTKAVTFVVNHFSKYVVGYDSLAAWNNPFADIKSSDWYYDAVRYVSANGMMNGQASTEFAAEAAMTRGMFVSILGRMENIDTTAYANQMTFSDVNSNQYYAPYAAWANDKGIVSGVGSGKFAPEAAITREQIAVMMTNYMKYKGQGPVGAWAIQLTYADLDQVSSWAGEGVMFMTMKNVMSGMGKDADGASVLSPLSTCTRAQAATMLQRLAEMN